ncbi:hypothetical protein ABNF65_22500 [Paenibacillus larvae]
MLKIRARQICPGYTRVFEVENAVMIRRESEESVGFQTTYLVGWLNTEIEIEKLVKKKIIMGLERQKEGNQTVYTFDFIYPLELISMEEYAYLDKEFNKLKWERVRQPCKYNDETYMMIARQYGEGYTRIIKAYEAILVKRQTEEPACIVKWICEPEDLDALFRKEIVYNLLHGDTLYKGKIEKICTFEFYYPYELISIDEFYSLSNTYIDLKNVMKQRNDQLKENND